MRPQTPGERARMQTTQVASLPDVCHLLTETPAGQDAHRRPIVTWEAGPRLACGFSEVDRAADAESVDGSESPIADASLRLPRATEALITQRVLLVERSGAVLSPPLTYLITGDPAPGPTGLVLQLTRVTDGSDTDAV